MLLYFNDIIKELKAFIQIQAGITGLFIGTSFEKNDDYLSAAKRSNNLYVHSFWFQGMLTNFLCLSELLTLYPDLHRRYFFNKRLKNLVKALKHFPFIPDYIFITQTSKQQKIIHEALIKNLLIIGVANNLTIKKCEVRNINYIIPHSENDITPGLYLMYLENRKKRSSHFI